jgi:Domain of unknown function (DUF4270)
MIKITEYSGFCLVVLCASLLSACADDDFNIGGRFIDSSIRTVLIDTCTIRLSTVSIDSVLTSGKNSVLAGSFSDTTFGQTECVAYVPFTVPGSVNLTDAEIVFDSIDLMMTLNGIWIGDTTIYHSFGVHLLDKVISLPDDENYYSTMSVPFGKEPIAVLRCKPHPLSGDTLSVRLPDQLGRDLLDKIMSDDQEVLGSQERFMDFFQGIALAAGSDINTVVGFAAGDSSMVIRIHFHYSTLDRTEGILTVTPYTSRCFYGVTTDRSGTPFSNLHGNELVSSVTGNMVLVQALTGSFVKIDFPYLNSLLEMGDHCTVTNASLKIYPVRGTYSRAVPLPEDLSLYVSNENDVKLGYITTYSGDALQTGNLLKDDLLNIETFYSYDITSFLQEQLGAIGIYRRKLQLIVPEASQAVTMHTLVAGDGMHYRNKMILRVSYLIYDGK